MLPRKYTILQHNYLGKACSSISIFHLPRLLNRRRLPQRLGKGDVKHTLLRLPETRKQREKTLSKKWLRIKEEIDYKNILRTANKPSVTDLGRHLKHS